MFPIPTARRAWVEDVIVDGSVNGQGIGRRLTEAMIDRARQLGCATVDLTSRPSREAANHLYKKVGFVERETNANDLHTMWSELRDRARSILDRAEAANDLKTALGGVRELTRLLDLPLRHAADLRRAEGAQQLQRHPEWSALRTAVCEALSDFPDARAAVVAALERTT